MIYTLEHQRFPNDLEEFYDIDLVKNIFYEYGDHVIFGPDIIPRLYDKYIKKHNLTNITK